MKILIIAGGTGGHIFPGLAVASTLQQQQVEIYWLGSEIGLERQLVTPHFPLTCIAAKRVRGKRFWNLAFMPWFLLRATWQALKVIKQIKPNAILAMGGFVSAPGGVAAKLSGTPLVIHEQNAIAGYTNRVLACIAKEVLSAFPNTFPKKFNPHVVGNPVRKEIVALAASLSTQMKSQDAATNNHPLKVLILGGSQGATAINQLIVDTLKYFPDPQKICFWHQTGQKDYEWVNAKYQAHSITAEVSPFIQEMANAYVWADLVICRSGALTVAELAAVGIASILIPFPYAVDDHQWHNGQYLANADAAILIRESEISPEILRNMLLNLSENRARLNNMANKARQLAKPQAAVEVAQILLQTAQ